MTPGPGRARPPESDGDLLAAIPYFRLLSAADRRSLARGFRPRTFARGATIFEEGAACAGLWVVAEGRVKVFRLSPHGREQVLHTEGPGATLGEVPLFDGGGYVASAAALEPTRMLWLPRRALEALCRRRPEVALDIIATMARRVRAFAVLAGDLTLRSVRERLALFLVEESRRHGRPTAQGVEVRLPGTRDEIAARIGSVREPVSRALASLRRAGLVRPRGRDVALLDLEGLEAMIGGRR